MNLCCAHWPGTIKFGADDGYSSSCAHLTLQMWRFAQYVDTVIQFAVVTAQGDLHTCFSDEAFMH